MIRILLSVFILCFASPGLAQSYQKGADLYKAGKLKEAMDVWRASAKLGNANSQYQYGSQHLVGNEVVKKDYAVAFKWLKKASDAGMHYAHYNLAQLYSNGWHVKKTKNMH